VVSGAAGDAGMSKVKRLTDHDAKEIAMFMQHIADMKVMSHDDFYRKYQGYMGLSDDELRAALREKASGKFRGGEIHAERGKT
jgi:hypothetical protein